MLAALIKIIKSGEAAEQNARDGAGAIARVQFEGDNEDGNISWKWSICRIKVAAHDNF